jgi:hypothetical protein
MLKDGFGSLVFPINGSGVADGQLVGRLSHDGTPQRTRATLGIAPEGGYV